jgi:hypothetical protein
MTNIMTHWHQTQQYNNSLKEVVMVQTHHLAGLQHLAHLRQEASVHPVRLVHQDRSQAQTLINNQVQDLEVHKTQINQTAINQYSQELHQQMLPAERTY